MSDVPVSSFVSAFIHHDACNRYDWQPEWEERQNQSNEEIIAFYVDYLCALSEMHKQSSLTKFTCIECFLRLYFLSSAQNCQLKELALLCCLELASKFCEDVNFTLDAKTLYASHGRQNNVEIFTMNSLLQAEIQTFECLQFCVDFQDSFFVLVESLIFGINWDSCIFAAEIFAIADEISNLVYITGLQSIIFSHSKVLTAAAVVLASIRVFATQLVFPSLAVVSSLTLLSKHCENCCTSEILDHSRNILSLVLEPSILHALLDHETS